MSTTDIPPTYLMPARALRTGMVVSLFDMWTVRGTELRAGDVLVDVVPERGGPGRISRPPLLRPVEGITRVVVVLDGERPFELQPEAEYLVRRPPRGSSEYATVASDAEPLPSGRVRVEYHDHTYAECHGEEPFHVVVGTPRTDDPAPAPDTLTSIPAHQLRGGVVVVEDDRRSEVRHVQVYPGYVYAWYANGGHRGYSRDEPVDVLAESLPGAYWLAAFTEMHNRAIGLTDAWRAEANDQRELGDTQRAHGETLGAAQHAARALQLDDCAIVLGALLGQYGPPTGE